VTRKKRCSPSVLADLAFTEGRQVERSNLQEVLAFRLESGEDVSHAYIGSAVDHLAKSSYFLPPYAILSMTLVPAGKSVAVFIPHP
jgi:hypothetical protein